MQPDKILMKTSRFNNKKMSWHYPFNVNMDVPYGFLLFKKKKKKKLLYLLVWLYFFLSPPKKKIIFTGLLVILLQRDMWQCPKILPL